MHKACPCQTTAHTTAAQPRQTAVSDWALCSQVTDKMEAEDEGALRGQIRNNMQHLDVRITGRKLEERENMSGELQVSH